MRTPRMLLALSIAGVIALAGCSAGGDADMEAPAEGGSQNEAPRVDEGVDEGTDDGAGGVDTDAGNPEPAEPGDTGEEVPDGIDPLEAAGMVFVTTTTVGLQVDDPYPVLSKISAYAEAHGGGRVYRDYTAATEHEGARGTITVKLPPREMNDAIDQLSDYGDVMSLEENRDDITVRVTNLEARIRIAEMALARAEGWFAEAKTREDEMAIEPLLNERIIALDDLRSQQSADSHDTALSTLTVEVFSPEAAPPPPPEPEPEPETGFLAGLGTGWNAFYEWGSDALRVIGVLLPWLLFLGLLVVAAYYIAKPVRRWLDSRPPRPARPVGPTTPVPPAGQRLAYQTAPGRPGVGQAGPPAAPTPAAGTAPHATLSDLLASPAPGNPPQASADPGAPTAPAGPATSPDRPAPPA